MATISYKCDTCKRDIELVENPQGFTVVGKCVITNGCTGRLYRTERNPNNVRESSPSYVTGLDNYVPRRAFYEFEQTLSVTKWKVTHNMGILPSTVVYLRQDNGQYVRTDNSSYTVTPVDKNTVMITFPTKVRGIVQCIAKSTVPLVPDTLIPESQQYQISANGVLTFAIPKYLTQIRGQIPAVSSPLVTPTVTPSPTPTQTPINMPLNLCTESNTIQIEIEITKPNEDPFVCFEDVENLMDSRSPWNGWGEVLVGKRRNYCVRTASLLKMKVFGNADMQPGDIPNGTRIRFLRIDYGTGRKEAIPGRGLLMLLAKSPYAYADKVKDRLVDVGELVGDTPDYFIYRDGELYLDETKVERSYPDISRVIYQAAPPAPSPTPTPTVTATVTPSVTISPTISLTPSPTVTPEASAVAPTVTPTPTVTRSVTPTVTVTPTITPSATAGSIVNPFDFAVIRYSWDENNGRDLDTRTAVEVPARLIDVGWSRSATDGAYLTWGGDNTSAQGPEAVLIDFNALAADYPDIEEFQIRMRTFWYSLRVDGNIKVTFETYLGGTMQHVGYDFINSGGVRTGEVISYVNSPTGQSGNIDGDDIGTLIYNSVNKNGRFITEIPAVTPTPTPSVTPTISVTPSVTPTISITPSVTPTISVTPSVTPTISVTPSTPPSGAQYVPQMNRNTTGHYFNIPQAKISGTVPAVTVYSRFKPNVVYYTSDIRQEILASYDDGTSFQMRTGNTTTYGRLTSYIRLASGTEYGGDTNYTEQLTVGQWHNGLVWFDGSSLSGSLDGVDGTVLGTASENALLINGYTIANRLPSLDRPFDAEFAYVCVWHRMLTEAERAFLGAGGDPATVPDMVDGWNFIQSTDVAPTSVPSMVSGGGTAMLSGTPTYVLYDDGVPSPSPTPTPTASASTELTLAQFNAAVDAVPVEDTIPFDSSQVALPMNNLINGLGTSSTPEGKIYKIQMISYGDPQYGTMWGSPYSSNRRTTGDSNTQAFIAQIMRDTSSPFAFLRSTQKFLIKIATSGQNSEYFGVDRNGISSLNYATYGGFSIEYVIYWDNTENRATKFDGVNLTYLPFTGTEY